ncbi:alpha/beta fold hydrolase [Thermodesulfobacteriota bacterium]
MPFVTVNNIQIYYKISGVGPRLLFISGTEGDLRRKPNIFDYPLAQHFEILAYDQRGLGRSDKPDISYTMMDYAMDADGLMKALGWDSCNVVGVSFGGMVAQEFALSYPQRIERLVLACTSSGGIGGTSYPLHELFNLSLKEKAIRIVKLRDKRRDKAWQFANKKHFQDLVDQTVKKLMVGRNEPGRKIGSRRQLEARLGHDTYDRLPNLWMPVLICGGRYDGIAPVENLKAICKQISNSRLELFEGGHLFYLQDSKAFELITEFLLSK